VSTHERTVMRAIVSWSLRYPYLVIATAVAVMVLGVSMLRTSPVDVFPEFAPPQVEVQTETLGLATNEVERLVTVPLELTFSGMPGLVDMRSKSVPQLSSIVLVFERGTDIMEARQQVAERIQLARRYLPTWAEPPFLMPPGSATARVLKISVTSDTYPLMELSRLVQWRIKPRLQSVDGVADVAVWNERQPTYQIRVDPQRMQAYGVTLANTQNTVSDALGTGRLTFLNGSAEHISGFLDTSNQRLPVTQAFPVPTIPELAEVPLAEQPDPDTVYTLGDLGPIVEDHQPVIGGSIINGKPGLLLIVAKLPWGNTLNVTRDVEAELENLKPGLEGVNIDTRIFRPASFVEDSINGLLVALLIGFGLVVLLLLVFLSEWRATVISLVTIPLGLMMALLTLRLAGFGINTMILAGLSIALGDVMDDSVVDVENILRRLRQLRAEGSDRPLHDIILEASLEIRETIVNSTLIDAIAISPVFVLAGLSASFFQPLALAYVLAILSSAIMAMTVTPALLLVLMRSAPATAPKSTVANWMRSHYSPLLSRIVARPGAAYATLALVLLVGVSIVPRLGQSLFPEFKQKDLLMHWVATPSAGDAEMARTSTELGQKLRAIPGVSTFATHAGRARQADEIVGMNFAEAWISIDREADYDETMAAVEKAVAGYPGMFTDVQTYLNERTHEVLGGTSEKITIRLYGTDLATLRTTAEKVRRRAAEVRGVVDNKLDVSKDVPQVQVKVDIDKAAKYGLKPGDVRRQAATMIAGLPTGVIFKDNQWYPVIVWSQPESRDDVQDVQDTLLDTADGGRVRLGEIADVRIGPDPIIIKRQNGSFYLDVGVDVAERDLAIVSNDIEKAIGGVELPVGVFYRLMGEYEERKAAQNALLVAAFVALIVIYLLFHRAFGSWRLATLLMVTLPMAVVGGLIGLWLGGGIVSIGALVGLLTVFGLAQGNGMLMITHCQHLEREEGVPFGPELVVQGARERLVPIMMTTLATGLALIPLLFYADQPGREIESPLAVVIIAGLFTSAIFTLFVVPSLYLRFGKSESERAASA